MLKHILKTMRPKQWTKNIFVFAPLVFDVKLTNVRYLLNTLVGFVLLCLVSGTVYIINDLVDAEKDRQHPKKRHRPIASEALSMRAAIVAAVLILAVTLPAGFLLDPLFDVILLIYLALQFAYSFVLKKIIIIDVMAIAGGFVLRVAAGIPLVEAERFSPWMYICRGVIKE